MSIQSTSIALPFIDTKTHPQHAFSLQGWIEDNKHCFRPPVGNKMIHGEGCEFKIMCVGGPNNRTDYHINEGEEWFYQLQGNMCLKVVDGGEFRDIHIKEGQCFLLPKQMPHSPQRSAGSVGLVIERERKEKEMDGLRWYCSACQHTVYEEFFHCQDLGTELKRLINMYYGDEELRTCKHCGLIDQRPTNDVKSQTQLKAQAQPQTQTLLSAETDSKANTRGHIGRVFVPGHQSYLDSTDHIDTSDHASAIVHTKQQFPTLDEFHPPPFSFLGWIEDNKHCFRPPVGNKMIHGEGCEFKIMCVGGPNTRTDYHIDEGEEWFYMVKGDMTLKIVDGGVHRDIEIKEGECFLLPALVPHSPQRKAGTVGLVVERERSKDELDGLRWYCSDCKNVTHETFFYCSDLAKELPAVINRYYADTAESLQLRTCPACGTVDEKPVAERK